MERTLELGDYRFVESQYAPGLRSAEHAFPHDYFCFVTSGSYREWEESGMHFRRAGTVHYHRAGARQAGLVSDEGARCLSVICDRGAGEACPPGFPVGMLLSSERQALLLHAFLEGSHFFLASFAESLFRAIRSPQQVPPTWLQGVERSLREDQGRPIEVLAKEAGVHPMHVWKAFRRWYGCTPGQHLREVRVERAQALLSSTTLSLSRIAHETGFADQSHFTRVFRHVTGETPIEFRRRSQPG